MIKLLGLAENLLYQFKSMSRDYMIADEFSEESSELSSEPEGNVWNLNSLTEIFQIIPS